MEINKTKGEKKDVDREYIDINKEYIDINKEFKETLEWMETHSEKYKYIDIYIMCLKKI